MQCSMAVIKNFLCHICICTKHANVRFQPVWSRWWHANCMCANTAHQVQSLPAQFLFEMKIWNMGRKCNGSKTGVRKAGEERYVCVCVCVWVCDAPWACPHSEENHPEVAAHTSPGLRLGGLREQRQKKINKMDWVSHKVFSFIVYNFDSTKKENEEF